MFLPTTSAELKKLKWDKLDVIIVTGDTYIDSPFIGASVIGQVLAGAGFRVGIIVWVSLPNLTFIAILISAGWENLTYSGESLAVVWILWSPTIRLPGKKGRPMT